MLNESVISENDQILRFAQNDILLPLDLSYLFLDVFF